MQKRDGGGGIMKKLKKFVSICLISAMICMMGCRGGEEARERVQYEYSDYEFNNDNAQYYMKSSAAAEDGYYYVANSPIYTESTQFLYYFDMINKNAIPLCTKLNCEHNDEKCDACLSSDDCVGNNIWYYNKRIYMVERTAEKDILVSYDKTGRDKKTCAILSVNGMSVNPSVSRSCVNKGRLYYVLVGENAQYLYAVSLTDGKSPELVKEYPFTSEYKDIMTLYPTGDYVYIRYLKGITEIENNYLIETLDVASNKITLTYDYIKDYTGELCQVDRWFDQTFFDEDGCFYYVSFWEDSYDINKLDLKTKETSKIYSIDISEDKGMRASYIKLLGFDGTYLYLYEQPDLSVKENRKNKELKNELHVIQTDGTEYDTITLKKSYIYEDRYGEIVGDTPLIEIGILAGDSRYLLITSGICDISGLEMTEEGMEQYKELTEKSNMAHSSGANVNVVGVLDKKQLGTKTHKWINITPE